MTRFDLTPLYRSSIGFDHLANMLDSVFSSEQTSVGYPPYNVESIDDNQYAVTLAVAGFKESEIDLQVEGGVLTVRGKKEEDKNKRTYLYQGIAGRSFERKFSLADYIEVTEANLDNGLLTIGLVRNIPEAMKPKKIAITKRSSGDSSHILNA